MAPARASGALNASVTNRHYAWSVDGRDAEVAAHLDRLATGTDDTTGAQRACDGQNWG